MKVFQNLLYKNPTRSVANRAGHSRINRGEVASSNTYSEMSESTGNHVKMYVDHPKDRSKLTCIIHIPGHSSDEFKVFGAFGFKYSKIRLPQEQGQLTKKMNKSNINQDNNAMVQHAVDQIILKKNNKYIPEDEAHYNINYKFDEDNLYDIENMSLDEKKEEEERRTHEFESELQNIYDIKNQNSKHFNAKMK